MTHVQQHGESRLPARPSSQLRSMAYEALGLLHQLQHHIRHPQPQFVDDLSYEKLTELSDRKLYEIAKGQGNGVLFVDPTDTWLTSVAVRQFVAGLKPVDQQIVVLLFWHGYSESQCAKHLGISQPAVSKRLKKILFGGREHFGA